MRQRRRRLELERARPNLLNAVGADVVAVPVEQPI
jgi:hypothetical protein